MLKRQYSQAERERLARTGAAMPDGSFPIRNSEDLSNAIQAVGRAANYEAAHHETCQGDEHGEHAARGVDEPQKGPEGLERNIHSKILEGLSHGQDTRLHR